MTDPIDKLRQALAAVDGFKGDLESDEFHDLLFEARIKALNNAPALLAEVDALRAEVARLRAALVMADGYIALRCGTPDPQDPYADQVLIDIQAQIKAARTGAEG